jgi:MFS family permease
MIVGGSDLLTLGGLIVTGVALAPIYPCMMTRTPDRLGPSLAAHAIGFQVSAAMIGAALLPAGSGLLAKISLENIAWASLGMAIVLLLLHEFLLHRDQRFSQSGT